MEELEEFRIGEKYFTNSWRHPNKLFVIEIVERSDRWITFKNFDGTIIKKRVIKNKANKYHSYERLTEYNNDKGFMNYYSFNSVNELKPENKFKKSIEKIKKILKNY